MLQVIIIFSFVVLFSALSLGNADSDLWDHPASPTTTSHDPWDRRDAGSSIAANPVSVESLREIIVDLVSQLYRINGKIKELEGKHEKAELSNGHHFASIYRDLGMLKLQQEGQQQQQNLTSGLGEPFYSSISYRDNELNHHDNAALFDFNSRKYEESNDGDKVSDFEESDKMHENADFVDVFRHSSKVTSFDESTKMIGLTVSAAQNNKNSDSKFDLQSTSQFSIPVEYPCEDPIGVAKSGNYTYMICINTHNRLFRFDGSTFTAYSILSPLNCYHPSAIVTSKNNSQGNFIYVVCHHTHSKLFRFNPMTESFSAFSTSGECANPYDVSVNGSNVYMNCHWNSNKLFKFSFGGSSIGSAVIGQLILTSPYSCDHARSLASSNGIVFLHCNQYQNPGTILKIDTTKSVDQVSSVALQGCVGWIYMSENGNYLIASCQESGTSHYLDISPAATGLPLVSKQFASSCRGGSRRHEVVTSNGIAFLVCPDNNYIMKAFLDDRSVAFVVPVPGCSYPVAVTSTSKLFLI
jgi:hypothetical protein